MKSKTYLYLGILAVLLIAAYFLTSDRGEKTASYKLTEKKLFEIDSGKVDKIEIKNKGENLLLSKASGDWRIEQPFQYRTVSSNVEALVSGLKNLKLESIVSTNPAKKDTYGFNDMDQAEVTVYESGVQKGKFLLGKTASGSASYIKKMDSDNIYLGEGIDRNIFIKPNVNDWKDKNIVSIPKQSINSVQVISEGETYTAIRDSSGKYFIDQDSAGKNFDIILNTLQKFDASGFRDTLISDQSDFTATVIVDNGNKSEFRFLKLDTTPVKYLLKVSGDLQVYKLDEVNAKNVFKTKKEITGK
ncbi:MAG: DUF4340 domain-containing protein [bacterium]